MDKGSKTSAGFREVCLDIEGKRLAPLALGLSLASALFPIPSLLAPGMGLGPAPAWVEFGAALPCFLIFLYARRPRRSRRLIRPLSFCLVALAGAASLHGLAAARGIEQTALVMLCLIGAGFFSLSTRVFMAEAAALIGAWLLASSPWAGEMEWVRYAERMAMAAILGSILHFSQLSLVGEFEALRAKSSVQARELAARLEEIRANEFLTRIVSEASFEGILIHDGGKIVYGNGQLDALFDYGPGEMAGMDLSSILTPEAWELATARIAAESDEPFECIGVRKDRSAFPLEMRGRTLERGEKRMRVVVIRDLSERKRMERALARSEANYRQLTENSLDLIVRIAADGRCLYVSPASERLLGYRPEEARGRKLAEFIHPLDRRAVFSTVSIEGLFLSSLAVTCRVRRKDGGWSWFESECQSFSDLETGEMQIVAVARDIGERVKAERYRAAGHAVTAIQAAGTGLEGWGGELLGAICGNLGWDIGELWLVDEEALVLRRAAFWRRASQVFANFCEESARMTFAPGVGLPGLAWSRGTVVWQEALPANPDIARNAIIAKARLHGALAFPLRDGPRIYGSVSCLSRSAIAPDRGLLDFLDSLGREIGEFMTRAKAEESLKADTEKLGELVEERTARLRILQAEVARQQRLEQEVLLAAEVQKDLLPKELPRLEGFELAAIALPARYISGDFYDFVSPDPAVCDMFIADISGKGIPAAMMTSAARALLREKAEGDMRPAAMLSRLNEALYADLDRAEMFLTAALVRLDTASGRFAYASAGHTEALLVDGWSGACLRLPSTATPIGILEQPEVGSFEARMKPGDSLVLYSDGVTEAADAGGRLFGMERLEAAVAAKARSSAENLAASVLAEVSGFSGSSPLADDLTIVVAKATPRILHLRDKAELGRLDAAVDLVSDSVAVYGGDTAYLMGLVVSELVTNVITHSYGEGAAKDAEFDLFLRLEADRIILDLFDEGKSFDPGARAAEEPDPMREGGRGLIIIGNLVDEMSYAPGEEREGDGGRRAASNHWRIVKKVGESKG